MTRPLTSVRHRFERRLDDAALPWSNDVVARTLAVAFASSEVLALAAGGWPMAAVTAVASVVATWVAWVTLRGRAALQVDLALPDVLEATARSLRSGTSLRIALSESTRHSPPRVRESLAAVVVAAERGVRLVDAIDVWSTTITGDGVRLAGAALALSAELGGAAARSLDGVAATLRDRNAVRREVRALSSQARASAIVIGVAPLGFAVLAATVDPTTIDFLLRTPAGVTCLVVGVVLDGLGAAWMHRLADIP
jgi:tight adherence protein B